ncbi:MAG: beta-galactosidase [Bacteroidales bacterium]|nr:beta-galactosidase [Bacteroidales bacterium]
MKGLRIMAAALASLLLAGCGGKADIPEATLPILAWYSIPAEHLSVERFQELKEAGFNINFSHIGSFDDAVKSLDCAQQAGVKVMFTCRELFTDPENTVKKVMDHPALFGYFLRDEPVNKDFPDLAAWADRIKAVDPDHVIYLNLNPNYAPEEYLGSPYREHVHKFIEEVRLPLVSFDFYPVTESGIRERWWENLEDISQESAAAGLPFWAFALSTAHKPYPIPTMASLRLQFYTDLAYGAQGLQYFTYWNPVPGTWDFHDAPIDLDGNRTPVYDMVKAMNAELQTRAGIFVGAKVLQVRHTGETVPPGVTPLTDLPEPLTTLDTHGKGAVVSVLENGGVRYLMLVNRSLDEGFDYDIAFARKVERIGRDGKAVKVPAKGTQTFHLEEGDCAIFRWK